MRSIAAATPPTMIYKNALPFQTLPARTARMTYLNVLTWLFTVFNSARVLA